MGGAVSGIKSVFDTVSGKTARDAKRDAKKLQAQAQAEQNKLMDEIKKQDDAVSKELSDAEKIRAAKQMAEKASPQGRRRTIIAGNAGGKINTATRTLLGG
jgi:hypothetical protein